MQTLNTLERGDQFIWPNDPNTVHEVTGILMNKDTIQYVLAKPILYRPTDGHWRSITDEEHRWNDLAEVSLVIITIEPKECSRCGGIECSDGENCK